MVKRNLHSILLATIIASAVLPLAATVAFKPRTALAATVPTRQAVLHEAMKYLHYPYAFSGGSPRTGFSCIGFVWYVFQQLGVDMPGNLSSAIAAYPRIRERDLLPGDIVFFQNTWWKGVSHVAIYIGDGKMIQAENPRNGVNITSIRNDPNEGNYWQEHYLVAERPLEGQIWTPPAPVRRPHGVVIVPSLNVRAGHSLNSVAETVLVSGQKVSILGSSDGWFKVLLSNGVTGWVIEAGVRVNGRVHGSSSGKRRHHTKLKDSFPVLPGVRIHRLPSLAASIVAMTTPGMTVVVLGLRGEFAYVRCSNGVSGWMASRFVEGHWRKVGTGVPRRRRRPKQFHRQPRPTHHGRLTITAHLRTGPSLTARIIRWVPAGTRVTVMRNLPLWDYVRVSPKLRGYVYSLFVAK